MQVLGAVLAATPATVGARDAKGEATVGALLILNYDVHDEEQLAAYRDAASPVLLDTHGAELVASTTGTVALEEAPGAATHSVVLRFASVEQAVRAYRSEEYQSLLAQRLAATTPRFAAIVPVATG